MTSAFPLAWPDNFPRSRQREAGMFRSTLPKALENVQQSLRLFGRDSGKPVTNVVLSSNVSLGMQNPPDPGIAAWFTWDGLQICIPVDRYSTPAANLQAIHHVLEARRTELRHGTLALVRATFQGFRALPSPDKRHWRAVLAVEDDGPVTRAAVEHIYRRLAMERHPDCGGDADAMAELNRARDEALREAI